MDNEYQRLVDETKEYVSLRYKLVKLDILEKTTKITSAIIIAVIGIVLGLVALTYFSLAVIFCTKDVLGGVQWGFLIFGCFFILLMIILGIFHKQLVLNPLVKQLSGILFAPDDEEDDEENGKCKKS